VEGNEVKRSKWVQETKRERKLRKMWKELKWKDVCRWRKLKRRRKWSGKERRWRTTRRWIKLRKGGEEEEGKVVKKSQKVRKSEETRKVTKETRRKERRWRNVKMGWTNEKMKIKQEDEEGGVRIGKAEVVEAVVSSCLHTGVVSPTGTQFCWRVGYERGNTRMFVGLLGCVAIQGWVPLAQSRMRVNIVPFLLRVMRQPFGHLRGAYSLHN
jgi:hypothetical protein